LSDTVIYDFYECQNCCLGYAVETEQMDEPACPSCGETNARYVISRVIQLSEGVVIADGRMK
jgi:PHP family Zn ribbon phosphoesterase